MAWMTDSLITTTPATDALGLVVRPVTRTGDGVFDVRVLSGSITIMTASFYQGMQVRNSSDTGWVNVGGGAESAAIYHVPMKIMGSGSSWIEPMST